MKKQMQSVFYMFLITLFFASLVSAVKLMNEGKIASNQVRKLRRVILRVMAIPAENISSEAELSLF